MLTSSDVQRQARRQYRIRMLIDGVDSLPLTFQRPFCIWSNGYEDGLLVLRNGDGLPEFGAWTSSSAVFRK
ncbi:hypothetical protein ACFCYM_04875 [Streptomyces sp. NPDC056254]|uniref:hypothetical protein n=1 Tax=Streptomyces sp. NPDC056254 TaxID=3345763 RepID=UPI0035DC8A9B